MNRNLAIFRKYIVVPTLCLGILMLSLSACAKPSKAPVDIPTEPVSFLQEIEKLIQANGYETLREYDGSETYQTMIEEMRTKDLQAIILGSDGQRYEQVKGGAGAARSGDENSLLMGSGSGIYLMENGSSYMYSGDYTNGIRSGHGKTFWKVSNGYEWSESEWVDDAPNGAGSFSHYGPYYIKHVNFTKTVSGTLVNGLWEGPVKVRIETKENQRTYQLEFSAKDGLPIENLHDQLVEKFPNETFDPNLFYYAMTTEYLDKRNHLVSVENLEDAWVLSATATQKLGTLGYGE